MTSHICFCGQPLRVFHQKSWRPGAPPIEQVDCQNRNCKLFEVTLSPDEHKRLTPAQINEYGRMQKTRTASR